MVGTVVYTMKSTLVGIHTDSLGYFQLSGNMGH